MGTMLQAYGNGNECSVQQFAYMFSAQLDCRLCCVESAVRQRSMRTVVTSYLGRVSFGISM